MVIPDDCGYADYRAIRLRIGYEDDIAMVESVWMGCDLEARRNMMDQLKVALLEVERDRRARPAWGTW